MSLSIDPKEIPDGMDYQWVVVAVNSDAMMGQLRDFTDNGWRAVPPERHPKLNRHARKHGIEYGGLLLVERPKFLTERAKAWEQDKADAQVLAYAHNAIRVNDRPINPKATGKRRTSIKEFFVYRIWIIRVWFRSLFRRDQDEAFR